MYKPDKYTNLTNPTNHNESRCDIKELYNKESCLVCSIILSLNGIYLGLLLYFISLDGLDGSN